MRCIEPRQHISWLAIRSEHGCGCGSLPSRPRLVEQPRDGHKLVHGFRHREALQLRPIKLEETFPLLRWRSALASAVPLVEEGLLHPEACGRAVQVRDKREVVVLRSALRQLNDRRRAVEHLPAAVEDEVVVGSDEGESDRRTQDLASPHGHSLPARGAGDDGDSRAGGG